MIDNDILAHAACMTPQESCGLVIHNETGEHYIPCTNQSPEPENHFFIAFEDFVLASQQGEVIAVVHSHPDGVPYLSAADRVHQLKTQLPWWLVCEGEIQKFQCVPPLLGREFVHGSTDCYGVFRDAYHLAGYDLPDFERQDNWWRQDKELYLNNLAGQGFRQVKRDIRPGDIILCCYASSRANHAAIYLGGQMILHHIPNQLSKREVYNERWQRFTHSIWRYQHWQPSAFTGIYNDLAAGLT
ncbi:C40 family peptidase [Xenorhabdus thuongxuanensis]|uniref:Tail protein n=1 Tax=Xenorhabdus thuongxuanensis TaxID=1873484 RepID=A0A1Q5U3Q2_9GAMM|nr:C40 family peptidase [Xenorhabdus thuongxuanensis]OKP07113.1 tail protein [Xenorhabdus thuongxuanensis]